MHKPKNVQAVCLAEPDEPWRHLLPLREGQYQRQRLKPIISRSYHHSFITKKK